MARTSRHDRGRETEYLVAEWYAAQLWPEATVGGRSEAGADVRNVPIDIEVKARADFRPGQWMAQSRKREHGGHVVLRLNGQGKEAVPGFMVIRRLDDDTKLLWQAGYSLRSVPPSC